jgi:hypothetical protein
MKNIENIKIVFDRFPKSLPKDLPIIIDCIEQMPNFKIPYLLLQNHPEELFKERLWSNSRYYTIANKEITETYFNLKSNSPEKKSKNFKKKNCIERQNEIIEKFLTSINIDNKEKKNTIQISQKKEEKIDIRLKEKIEKQHKILSKFLIESKL